MKYRHNSTNNGSYIKLEFHDADIDTDTDILTRILADTSDTRFPEVIPMVSSTTRRHSRDDPRADVGEEVRVGVGVGVGVVEYQLMGKSPDTADTPNVGRVGRVGEDVSRMLRGNRSRGISPIAGHFTLLRSHAVVVRMTPLADR